jgi:hypothetical protein
MEHPGTVEPVFGQATTSAQESMPMRTTLFFSVCLLLAGVPAAAEEATVPAWFRPDPKNPYAIFDAWRNLSTTEAAVCWQGDWSVYAGCLRDERGKPMANCPLWIFDGNKEHDGSEFGFGGPNQLKTDKDGCFIIYSPRRELDFSAAPGYPFSAMGLQFAEANKDLVACDARVIRVADDRRFYVLTCPRKSTYDEKEFRKFFDRQMAEWRNRPRLPDRARVQPLEDAADRSVRNKYRVRVVSPKGKPIPDALLTFWAWDGCGQYANEQTVATDDQGNCTLVEELLPGEKQKYYDGVARELTADIPGYAAGPLPFDLRKDKVNVITAKPAATIRGKLVDWNGNAVCDGGAAVGYDQDNYCSSSLHVKVAPDGTFEIGRIMPGEPLFLGGGGWLTAGVSEGPFTLMPGEIRKGVVLRALQPAAVQGIVVDAEDAPVRGIRGVFFIKKSGGGQGVGGAENDNRFGISGLTPDVPYRIRVEAAGFDTCTRPAISLKSGEVRFVKVVMRKTAPKQPASGGNR